jgi:DNA-binding NtrC family response regulator
MDKPRVLIIDDNAEFVGDINMLLQNDYHCTGVPDAESGLELLGKRTFDVILLDIELGAGMNGFEFLERIRKEDLTIPVVMITKDQSVGTVVKAMKLGASDYVGKKPDLTELKLTLRGVIEEAALRKENQLLREEIHRLTGELLGVSETMNKIRMKIAKLSQTDSTVLITGETGTGKELVARQIHQLSARGDKPFVAVNCAAIPRELFESELFGHEKGAFTGALKRKLGKFELANRGTIFLDEVGELAYSVQAKLLRVLQEKRCERVGGDESLEVDVRVIAATNKDLERRKNSGEFRDDLFFRLNVAPLHISPLRQRRQDIPVLAREFVRRKSEELKKDVTGISQDAMAVLLSHDWPGNVRELENVIENAIIYAENDLLSQDLFPKLATNVSTFPNYEAAKQGALHRFQREYISAMLRLTGGNITQSAERMGISRQGLQKMIKNLGMHVSRESIPPKESDEKSA